MQDFDLHMHTVFCDGSNTAEEMVLAASERGLKTAGLSGHSYTWFDESYCMSRDGTAEYIAEVNRLKDVYAGRIRVLLGIELDYHADTERDIDMTAYDYIIGSSHYILKDGVYLDSDNTPGILQEGIGELFGGDPLAAAECYYGQVGDIAGKTNCDIIGHFDLITKFNERCDIMDTGSPRYVRAWQAAVDRIFEDTKRMRGAGRINRLEMLGVLECGDRPVFEINIGAMIKGYRTSPYPAADQIEYIKSKGGVLILSSDSHRAETVGDFGRYAEGFSF